MADGSRPTLEVEQRDERGTRATRRLRRDGLVPGVVYGGGSDDAVSFKVNARELRHVLVDGSALIDLKVDGQTRPVIVKDSSCDPVRDEIIHIDLLEVRLDEKIQTQVARRSSRASRRRPGVKEGGVLEQVSHQLNIEALPTAIPEAIVVDVSGMEIAATMHLSEITAPEGVEFLDDLEETIIATVVVPTEVEEPEEIEEETELVGEDGEADRGRRRGGRGSAEAPARGSRRRGVLSLFRRGGGGEAARSDWLVVGLGQPGRPLRAAPATTSASRSPRWPPSAGGCRARRSAAAGLYTDGRTGPGGPRVGVLLPQTYMNDSGKSVSPARGELRRRPRPRGRGPRRDRPAVRPRSSRASAAAWPATTG